MGNDAWTLTRVNASHLVPTYKKLHARAAPAAARRRPNQRAVETSMDQPIQTTSHAEWIALPQPRTSGGLPLLDAVARRRSSRAFRPDVLPPQLVSDLLWCAMGVNRADEVSRTAPSARNWQEIEIYVVKASGAAVYDPRLNGLRMIVDTDLRYATGLQDFVASAPLNLVYVADLERVDAANEQERRFYCAADAGFVAQNVYLFCSSEGLATVVRGLVDRPRLATLLRLRPRQRVLLAQTIGWPP